MNIIVLAILFLPLLDYKAALRIRGINATRVALQVIHGALGDVKAYDLPGDGETDVITVQDAESLTILAYQDGSIVGSAIFEVRMELVESLGAVLVPHSLNNVLVDQQEFGEVQRAFDRSLEHTVISLAAEEGAQVL